MTEELIPRSRWLVVADQEPGAVRLESYAERTGELLRGLGQEVLLVRPRRGALPARRRAGVVEVELAPCPVPPTDSNRLLARGIRFQRVLGELAPPGRFDALLCEGPLGALVGPPLASRLEIPLVLALPDCEVARRGNQLTKEQLYLAELEHWGAERAAALVVPTEAAATAVAQHYKSAPSVLPVPVDQVCAPGLADVLCRRLGLAPGYLLILGEDLGERERVGALAQPFDRPVVWAGKELWHRAPGADPELRARWRSIGPALGALLSKAHAVLIADRSAERRADALALAGRSALVEGAKFAEAHRAALEPATPNAAPDPVECVRALVRRMAEQSQARAARAHEPALL